MSLTRFLSEAPDQDAFLFLGADGSLSQTFSRAGLLAAVAGYAAALAPYRGARVILMAATGPEFVAGFLGCLQAGAIAVPVPAAIRRARLRAIAEDCAATGLIGRVTAGLVAAAGLTRISPVSAPAYQWADSRAEDLAFLQYTSGSTGRPKGVRIRHGDIARNAAAITERFAMTDRDTIVSWLPLFHDMGLMGSVLQVLFSGGRAVLMPPETFLRRPAAWLEAISRYGGTVSGAPDFGYDLAWRNIGEAELAGLDLSSWRAAFNGAEPIRPETLSRFAERFAPVGFHAEAFLPSYGMAEATLLVAAERAGQGAHQITVDPTALEQGILQLAAEGQELVSSGTPGLGSEIRILDPDSGAVLPAGRVGEIELSKGSLAGGYWGQTEPGFAEGRFATGDLGAFLGDRLFVLGRRDDMIQLRGRNVLLGEVEAALAEVDPDLARQQVMVIAPGDGADRQLVALIETADMPPPDMPTRLRSAVLDRFGLTLDEILWLQNASLPRTTSGKPRRAEAVERYEAGGFKLRAQSALAQGDLTETLTGAAPLVDRLCGALAIWCGLAPGAVRPDHSFADLGMESLSAVRLLHEIEAVLGLRLGLEAALGAADINTLAERLEGAAPATAIPQDGAAPRLSSNQKALWLFQDLTSPNAAYTIAEALRLDGLLAPEDLRTAIETLVDRHEQLRVNLELTDAGVQPRLQPQGCGCDFAVHEATGWTAAELQAALDRRARVPFDLGQDRLLRADLFHLGTEEHVLLISVHHAVCDLWSLALLVKELSLLLNGKALPPLRAGYQDHLRAAAAWCAGPEAQRALDWYRNELAGDLPHLGLGHDRLRPARPAFRGARLPFGLPPEVGQALGGVAAEAGTTLHNLLLCAWALFLRRATDQDEVLVGVPCANRRHGFEADVVGYLVNLGVLRDRSALTQPFTEYLAETTCRIERLLEHAALPLADIAAAVAPDRGDGHSGLFQSVFNYNGSGLPGEAALATSGLAEGRALSLGPLQARTMAVETGATQFDLSCTMASGQDGALLGAIQYDCALFDPETVTGFARAFEALLRGIARDANRLAADLPLMRADEEQAWRRAALGAETGCAVDFRLRFEDRVQKDPEAIAIRDSAQVWSYGALNRYANALAETLAELGAGPGRIVALRAARGAPYLGAMLAIAKTGACYMPLSPRDPAARLSGILKQARPAVVLTDGETALPDPMPEPERGEKAAVVLPLPDTPPEDAPADPPSSLRAQDPSYVIFTSGSTGLPKGAVVHAEGNGNHLEAMVDLLQFDASDVMAQTASVASDISVWQFLVMATVGGRVEVFEDALIEQPAEFLAALEARGVTMLQVVPAVLEMLAVELERPGAPPPPRSLRWVSSCGEALAPSLARRWMAAAPHARLINAFGPAECSDDTSVALYDTPPPADAVTVSIGRPLRNLACYVLDRREHPLPPGMTGELWIGGRGVGLGYLADPLRTAEAFRPDPFSATPGARLYRTGDLARRRADGSLDYLGRRDSQVQIRGFRVEIGEVEAALRALPGVRHAAVGLHEGARPALVALYAPADLTGAELRRALGNHLPGFMVPDLWVPMSALPFNMSGKIDRKALPAPTARAQDTVEPPVSEAERSLAAIWQTRLGHKEIGRHDSFFDLGGHSLMAIQMIADIRAQLGMRLSLRDVFDTPRLSDLALRLVEAGRGIGSLQTDWPPARQACPVPLTAAQRRMWFLHQLNPQDRSYSMTGMLRFKGELDKEALRGALGDVMARHRVLRMRVESSSDGQPRMAEGPWPEVRDSDEPAARIAAREAETGFDLAAAPVLRLTLTQANAEPALVVAVHHIVFDGWSIATFLEDISAHYRARIGQGDAPAKLAYDFVDYAAWCDHHWTPEALDRSLKARKARFGTGLTPLDLPYDAPDPGPGARVAGQYRFEIPQALNAQLQDLAGRSGVTPFLILLAAFQMLLARITGAQRFDVGTLIAGRARPGMEQLIGLLINVLPVPADFSGNPDGYALLARLKRDWLDLQRVSDLPFDALVAAETGEQADPAQAGLNCFFVMQNQPMGPRDLGGGLRMVLEELPPVHAPYDLLLDMEPQAQGFNACFRYSAARFDAATVRSFADAFLALLQGLLETPERAVADLPAQGAAAGQQQAHVLTGADRALPGEGRLFPALFEDMARRHPQARAAADGEEWLSYGDLLAQADRIAAALQARGIGPEDVVGVHGRRSVAMLVALLGILRAGAAYMPLDPGDAPSRLAEMLEETGAKVVLTCGTMPDPALGAGRDLLEVDALRHGIGPALQPVTLRSDTLAYVIYTSGSTGRPKGAMVTHHGMLNHLWAKVVDLDLTARDRVAETAPQSFDVSIWQFLSALLVGGSIHVFDEETAVDPSGLLAGLARAHVTVAETVPGLLRAMNDVQEVGAVTPLPALRWMLVTGEALSADAAQAWRQRYPAIPLMNAYGPTECSDDVTHHVIDRSLAPGRSVPIGKTILNTRLYVLDARLMPVPKGAAGRLWVGGVGVGRGYVAAQGKTAMAFRPDPFARTPGARMYDTGDIVRLNAAAELVYLGRADHQIKLAGQRIEPGEIETCLRRLPFVRDCVVMLRGARLVAYAVLRDPPPRAEARLLAEAAQHLPRHMVPAGVMTLPALPRTANGKLDRAALPDWQPEVLATADGAPATETERQLAELARDVLAIAKVPVTADFFAIGGTSLQAMQLIALARRRFAVDLPLAGFYRSPNLRALAIAIETGGPIMADGGKPLPQGELPLTPAQERLWMLQQLEGERETGIYTIVSPLRLHGPLDLDRLQGALQAVLAAHPALRLTFHDTPDGPRQRIGDRFAVSLDIEEVADLSDATLDMAAGQEAGRPFDLKTGPLLRARLLRKGAEEAALVIALHHIIADGASMDILLQDLARAYGGERLEPVDTARWITAAPLHRHPGRVVRRLQGLPPFLDLPGDREGHDHPDRSAGNTGFWLQPEQVARLDELCRNHGVTRFMAISGVVAAVMGRIAGRKDMVFGTDTAGRDGPGSDSAVGFLVNQLPIRLDLSGEPDLAALLARSRAAALAAFEDQDVPFQEVVRAVKAPRQNGRMPVFQLKIIDRGTRPEALRAAELELRPHYGAEPRVETDLMVELAEIGGGLKIWLTYRAHLFDRARVESWRDCLKAALCGVLEQGEQWDIGQILPPAEPAKGNASKSPMRLAFRRPADPGRGACPEVLIPPVRGAKLAHWLRENREEIDRHLYRAGAVLLRGAGITDAAEFEAAAASLSREMIHENGEHEPVAASDVVQTPVRYPADVPLRAHNENTFNRIWPGRIMFACLTPAETGGETTVLDGRRIYQALHVDLRDRFAREGIRYRRVYQPGLEKSWQQVYGTTDPAELARACAKEEAELSWQGDVPVTEAWRPAVARHPVTNEMTWVGQVPIWHPACHDPETTAALRSVFAPEALPRTCWFGGGGEISDADAQLIARLCAEAETPIAWQQGDMAVVDNLLAAHGRRPYTGQRRILVALSDPVEGKSLAGAP
ncbi:amino acid adenylation domain-containing protein [Phaeobacter sp. QD34_3]|uniref:non-ribosomal peptide synthetase n=1 Tax=Phaeobacter sp. QD34_24 TaxID=3029980 RepID=UPI00237F3B1D|nr:non-ribosomal peptide synthetase [Phaeobacter sp. QD34_24]MDE4133250.1 amino acid adenylation domain-containing protein [Phaeobacter sp. QD34_3]